MSNRKSQFRSWLAGAAPAAEQVETEIISANFISEHQQKRGVANPQELYGTDFITDTQATLKDGRLVNRQIHNLPMLVTLTGTNPAEMRAYRLTLLSQNSGASLTGFGIDVLTLRHCGQKVITLREMFIRRLEIDNCRDVRVEDCWIGELDVTGRNVGSFRVTSGGIHLISCTPPGLNPFSATIHFDRSVYFPRTTADAPERVQSYRNMRSHMLALENTPMVNRFHTLEQATERRLDGLGFNRFVSWLYEKLSDYGSSAFRPVLWLVAMTITTGTLIYCFDGAVQAQPEDYRGWQEALEGYDAWPAIERAFVLTMQATLNPLGIFGIKGLLIARYEWLALWLSFHGLATAVLVALFVFAIRRRFKMS